MNSASRNNSQQDENPGAMAIPLLELLGKRHLQVPQPTPMWGPNSEHFHSLVTKDRVRNETFIYHAEFGINTHHEDFQERRIEWIFTPRAEILGQDTKDEAPGQQFGHSTCTASKAAGRIYGAPKGATLVVIKMPDFRRDSVKEDHPHILDHIQHEGRSGVSVVSISWNGRQLVPYAPLDIVLSEMYSTLEWFLRYCILVVCSAGNYANHPDGKGGLRTTIDTAPAARSDKLSSFFLIAIAAPLVAGVLADFVASEQMVAPFNPRDVPHFLYSLASYRRLGGQCVIWNRVDSAHNPPVCMNGNACFSNLIASFSEMIAPHSGQLKLRPSDYELKDPMIAMNCEIMRPQESITVTSPASYATAWRDCDVDHFSTAQSKLPSMTLTRPRRSLKSLKPFAWPTLSGKNGKRDFSA
ncbi:hypothetical protein OEA41_003405 [Lepraria neglecta]|uniref:Peptidase S8/S53 domain-containing protein n=1 Tax=Lepraria neglecta TaxID=209136 RepID=A0AAD9Z5N9_9LECA|nr:hypothetical protein OEA41_003405 [Lepraria neglecta]